MLQTTNVANPDGTSVANKYSLTGMLTNTVGSRTFPVGYTYDAQGRMKTMTTWTNYASAGGSAVTTWNYDPYRGWLSSKRYADNTGPDYTYSPAGRLKTRTWARTGTGGLRIVATYSYGIDDGLSSNDHGDLVGVAYSNDPQSTSALTYTYDRRGRQRTVVQGSTTTTLTFNDANQQMIEGYSGGTLGGMSVTNGYDPNLRRTNLSILNSSSTVLVKTAYGYDAASRLQTVTDNSGGTPYSASYSYLANSPLVSQILFKQSSMTRMTSSNAFDYLNRLTQKSSLPGSGPAVTFAYAYNNANQRVRTASADGSYWNYMYDALGQVTSGRKYWSDETPVAGQQFEYAHDDIGNRRIARAGGDNAGASLRIANYTPNNLNEYTSRDIPGAVDVMGLELATNAVTVNSLAPYRKGEYYRKEVTVANSSTAVWQSISVAAPNETTVTGNAFVPKTQEVFTFDLDGNLTSDGRWNYSWDAENRLVSLVANTAVGPQQSMKVEYDAKGRRIGKRVWPNLNFTDPPTLQQKFLYDGWNLVGVLNSSFTLQTSFYWGTDLSGSIQGAGGVGGLLEINDVANGVHFVGYDGNGNVSALVKGADGTVSARYEYGPFGELLRATGPMAKANPFRFSTKYQDDESDLLYYGFRYLSSSLGCWPSRDPKEEPGASLQRLGKSHLSGVAHLNRRQEPNPYDFLNGSPTANIDVLGLCGGPSGGETAHCGDNVTSLLYRTFLNISTEYNFNWTTRQQSAAAYKMFYDFLTAVDNWDMRDIQNYPYTGSPGPCEQRLTFENTCVRQNELNYMMYGLGISLTESDNIWSIEAGEAFRRLEIGLRSRKGDSPDAVRRKVNAAKYGYIVSGGYYSVFYSGITADSFKTPENCPTIQTHGFHPSISPSDWVWEPNRSRSK
jgi:RHS repeat-associated protein